MAEPMTSILLVDDDLTLREMYAERLKADGFVVEMAKDGEEALQKVESLLPAIILLDIMMPKINGLDVLKKLKEKDETKKIPVLVLTALIQDKDRMESVTRGADGYIVKSETMPGEVIQKIKDVLEKKAKTETPQTEAPATPPPSAPQQ